MKRHLHGWKRKRHTAATAHGQMASEEKGLLWGMMASEKKLLLKGKVNGRNGLNIKTLVIKEIIF